MPRSCRTSAYQRFSGTTSRTVLRRPPTSFHPGRFDLQGLRQTTHPSGSSGLGKLFGPFHRDPVQHHLGHDRFHKKNGATQFIPGSHLWDTKRRPLPGEVVKSEMTAGSVLLYNGTVFHGGGSNETEDNRPGVLIRYTLNWLRQEENQYLSSPPNQAKDLTPELRRLMDHARGGPVLGFYSTPGAPGEGFELSSP